MQNSPTPELDPLGPPLRRNWVWWGFQMLMQNVFCFWLGYRAHGIQQLDDSRGGLIIANHESFLDPLLVGLPLERPVSFLARDSLFRVPVLGWILQNTYVFPINRDAASTASLREAIRRLKLGFLVGIFPEGTRTVDGQVGTFKPGFLAIIRRSKLPVYPVGIAGAFEAMPRGCPVLLPSRVRVVFGAPISPEELAESTFDESQLLERLRQAVVDCQTTAEIWRRTGNLVGAVSPTRVEGVDQT